MKRYSIYHIPVMSFFSKNLYRDVASQWKGTCFVYLLLLLIICWIAPISKLNAGLGSFIDNEAPGIISQVPVITIANGTASIKESQPYYIKDPETGKILFIIDTTGKITSLAETEATILLTKTEGVVRKSEMETRTFSLAQMEDLTLDQGLIWKFLTGAKKLLFPLVYPVCILGSFIFRIIQALIYGVIGMLFALMLHSKRPYDTLLRLAVVAVTPAIIIKTLVNLFGIGIPVPALWYFLIAMGYLFFGVKAASKDDGPATESA